MRGRQFPPTNYHQRNRERIVKLESVELEHLSRRDRRLLSCSRRAEGLRPWG